MERSQAKRNPQGSLFFFFVCAQEILPPFSSSFPFPPMSAVNPAADDEGRGKNASRSLNGLGYVLL